MNAIINCSRRSALKAIGAAGGLVLGTRLIPGTFKFASAAGETTLTPSVFVAIAKDGTVTLFAHRSEMGQGIRTGLTMLLADELEADWARVKVEQADGDEKYGDQYTDGSRSIVKNFQRLREFGATARLLLEQAAAKQLGVDVSEVKAQNHKVVHAASGKSLDYGELVETAAALPVPDVKTVKLKDPKDFRYIGKEVPIVDLPNMMVGTAKYTIDIRLPGMKYASVERCPVVLGKFASYDASETLKVPGVEKVVEIPPPTKPVMFKPLGGIAVVATNSWAAMEGRSKLKVQWDLGENASYDTTAARKEMEATASKPGDRFRSSGEIGLALLLGGWSGHIALACVSSALRQITVLTTFAAEEDERVLRPLDVILVTLLRSALAYIGDGGAPAEYRAGKARRRPGRERQGMCRRGFKPGRYH